METHAPREVFVSYCRENSSQANLLIAYLEELGVHCWIDKRNIGGGSAWAEAISHGLKHCKMMLFIYSSESNKSTYVRNEVAMALEKDKHIIPVRIENVPISDSWEVLLKHCQWMDAFGNPKEELREVAQQAYYTLKNIDNKPYDDELLRKYNKRWTRKGKSIVAAVSLAVIALVVIAFGFHRISPTTSEATPPGAGTWAQQSAGPVRTAVGESRPAAGAAVALQQTPVATAPPASPTPQPSRPAAAPAALGREYAALSPVAPTRPARDQLQSGQDVQARIVRFLSNYQKAYNYGSAADVITAYAPEVNYFNTPSKSKSSLYKDMSAYFDRWQLRRSRLQNDIRIEDTADPTVKRVTFSYVFYRERGEGEKQRIQTTGYNKSPKDNRWCSSGTANDTLTLKVTDTAISIVGETQNYAKIDQPKNVCKVLP